MAGSRLRAANSTIIRVLAWNRPSKATRRASTCRSTAVSNARPTSSRLRTSRSSASEPKDRAAVFVSSHCGGETALLVISLTKALSPVTLRPGCARLSTIRSGSPTDAMITGRPGRILGGDRGRRSSDHDEVDPEPNQFGRQLREPLGAAIGGAIFDGIVFSFYVTEFAQALPEGVEMRGVERRRYGLQHPNSVTLRRLLRTRHERPYRYRAAE